MSTTKTNQQVGEELITAMTALDVEAVLQLIHPEVVINEPDSLPYGGTWNGREGFARLMERIVGLAELSIDGAQVHETDDGMIAQLEISLKSRKDAEVYRTSVVEVDRFEDAMLRHADVYYRDASAARDFLARQ